MQHKYVGDVGDYGKLALLRQLTKSSGISLGIVWHLVEGEKSASKDGKHRKYLSKNDLHLLGTVDPALYKELCDKGFSEENESRCLQELYEFLSKHTIHVDDNCHRIANRKQWVMDAVEKMTDCDLVFFDPDNGIQFQTDSKPWKYVHVDELKLFWKMRKSMIVYHHLGRNGSHADQRDNLQRQLDVTFPDCFSIENFHFRRGTSRIYFLLLQESHYSRLKPLINAFRKISRPLQIPLAEYRKEVRKTNQAP